MVMFRACLSLGVRTADTSSALVSRVLRFGVVILKQLPKLQKEKFRTAPQDQSDTLLGLSPFTRGPRLLEEN